MSDADPRPDAERVESVAGPELTAGELHDILFLREQVFVVEQACPYPEIDGRDLEPETRHVWVADADGVAAYLRVLADHSPQVRGDRTARQIGRVVTRADRRGEHLAASLMRATLDHLGQVQTRLEAQSHLVGYYASFGYSPSGPEYIEDGIPHTPMRRPAIAATNGNER